MSAEKELLDRITQVMIRTFDLLKFIDVARLAVSLLCGPSILLKPLLSSHLLKGSIGALDTAIASQPATPAAAAVATAARIE